MRKSKMVGGKIKKRSIFKKYNPIRSFKKFFGLTKKETYKEMKKRQKKKYNNFKKSRQKEINNKKAKRIS